MSDPVGRRGLAVALLWTLVATILFAGFGFAAARAVTRTLLALGTLDPATEPLLLEVLRCVAGILLLGLSSVYRRLAETENAGSLAAWLAGWVLVASQGARLVSRVSEAWAVALLLGALAVWGAVRLVRLRRGGEGPA